MTGTNNSTARNESRELCSPARKERGFTLLEVMIAVAVLGFALMALLSLHNQNLRSVIRTQEITTASMLAQSVMTRAELERFPLPGDHRGDFRAMYGGLYPNFRWERIVQPSGILPTVREVKVIVYYGQKLRDHFVLIEFMHDPVPPANGELGQPPEAVTPPPPPPPWVS